MSPNMAARAPTRVTAFSHTVFCDDLCPGPWMVES